MSKEFDKLVNNIARLRADDGCPWDKEQTIETMREDILGEASEVAEAISNNDHNNLKEEIGDLIWTCILTARIAEESGKFDIEDCLNEANAKVISRHPHVFGGIKVNSAEEAMELFQEAKAKEKDKKLEFE